MKGLEIAEKYYNTYGKPAIEREFSKVAPRIAAGLVGQGSECFGFDDELSRDHDFEPGFCLWVTREDYEKFGFELEKMYARLPKEFMGLKRLPASPVGGSRHGVMVIDEFYEQFLGIPHAPSTLEQWMYIPSEGLSCACNGKVFEDKSGRFTDIRNKLLAGYPEDVRPKKISANMIMMAQTGLYNYGRCILRGEYGAAQICVHKFVMHAISLIFLLNKKYEPFYKWVYRAVRDLERLSELGDSLAGLSQLGNDEIEVKAKKESMEEICTIFSEELLNQGIIDFVTGDFEQEAYAVQNKIKNAEIRNMHIMDGI